MLRKLYHILPLSEKVRGWVRKKVPLRWQRQSQFRQFGVIDELYLWRLDEGIDTVAPIENYFSGLFPDRDTTTEGRLWLYDCDGNEISHHHFKLPHNGLHVVRVSELVDRAKGHGTLMWHIKMPDCVAKDELVRKNLVYFTDRGYICYEKDGSQPAFVHGVDRYAVFQRQATDDFDLFYPEVLSGRKWLAEFPVHPGMQDSLDVVLLNRATTAQDYSLTLFRNGGDSVYHTDFNIKPRGAGVVNMGPEVLAKLGESDGYFLVDGIPTTWGRPAIMRHFSSGAISVMHC